MKTVILFITGVALTAAVISAQTPSLMGINPPSAPAGSVNVSIFATGANFQNNAYIAWNGQVLPTVTYGSTQATATIPGTFLVTQGYALITVVNPGVGQSNPLSFSITAPPISISTASLPAGAAGVAYSATLSASGGMAPYSWTAVSALPPGLTLLASGTITGTPSATGTFAFTVRVMDASQAAATRTFSLVIAPPPIDITTASPLPPALTGQSYTVTLVVSGGNTPYRWASTQLPPGLRLDPVQGVLSGTPSSTGTFKFAVQVTDAGQLSATKEFSLTVTPPPLAITTVPPLFAGTAGTLYAQTFSASGGVPPYTWSITSGSAGMLTLDPNSGSLQGTPQTVGTLSFTVQVTDRAGAQVSQAFTITVNAPTLSIITSATLPGGTVDAAYTTKLTAAGGTPPYTWTLLSGAVPGITLDASGTLNGTAKSAGTFNISIQARDSQGLTATRTFTIAVAPAPLKFTTPAQCPDGTLGAPFSQPITATGGMPPYIWAANGIPEGLGIDPVSGLISGTPAAAGSFQFTVRVTDSARNSAVELFRLAIGLPDPPNFTISALPRTTSPAEQVRVRITMDRTFPVPINGQAMLGFIPDSGAGDGTILFSTGGRNADFGIPAGETEATFAVPSLAFQTGTVAGSISVSLRLQAGGIDITPLEPPAASTRIERAAPAITAVRLVRTPDGFNVEISGFCTAREITQANFKLSAGGGRTLQSSEITIPMDSLFSSWFQDAGAAKYGSQFTVVQPFKVQGDATVVNLDSVILTNRLGTATSGVTP